jgi:peptidoglycan/LPS O-acetylase OafA/YrhL
VTVQQADPVSPPNGMQGKRVSRAGFRGDIEGLRAVAVLAVVCFHAAVPGVNGGFIGVDVFFVISGFLITGLLWREVETSGTVRLGQFYGARARRLLPASAVVGVATAIGSALLLPPLEARTVFGDAIASALYVGNYRLAFRGADYFAAEMPPSPFQHYWSLGVEEQFYLVWPALIIGAAWLVRRKARRAGVDASPSAKPYLVVLLLVGVVSFAVSLAATHVWPSGAFYSLPTRAWELAAGGLVALTVGAWRRLPATLAAVAGWGGLALILLTCVRLSATTPYPGIAAVLPVLGTALVIGAGCAAPPQGVGRALSLPPMRAVGRVSYSWYLWHWPVLLLAPPLLGHPLGLAGRLIAAAVSCGLAVLTLYVIENPIRFADPVRRSAAASLALGGAATAVAVSVGVVLLVVVPVPVGRGAPATPLTVTAGHPKGQNTEAYDADVQHAFAQVEAAVAASADLKAVPSNLDPPLADASGKKMTEYLKGCLLNFVHVKQPECATGDTASTTTVALIGDSHSVMWSPAFQQVVDQRRWRLENLGKSGCPMTNLPVTSPILHREYTECEQWRSQMISRLQEEHPQLVVLSVPHRADYDSASFGPAWFGSLTAVVAQLRGTGAQVLVLSPIPDPGSTVPICLSGHLDDAMVCAPPRSLAVNESEIAAEAAAVKAGGGHFADVTALFCTADRCPVVVGNTLVYPDTNHLTIEYARVLAPVVGVLTDRALAGG